MFVPPNAADVTSWLQIVSDPVSYKGKIEELARVSSVSQRHFEENKILLQDLDRQKKEFTEQKTTFDTFVAEKTEKIQSILDDLYVRNIELTKKEEAFNQKEKELIDSLSYRENELRNRESLIYSKESSIDSDYNKAKEYRVELEQKLARLRTIKDLID